MSREKPNALDTTVEDYTYTKAKYIFNPYFLFSLLSVRERDAAGPGKGKPSTAHTRMGRRVSKDDPGQPPGSRGSRVLARSRDLLFSGP